MGAMLGATRADDFTRKPHEFGLAAHNHASSRTDPDEAEQTAGIYGSEGWGFESLRARHCLPRSAPSRALARSVVIVVWPHFGRISGFGRLIESVPGRIVEAIYPAPRWHKWASPTRRSRLAR